MSTVDLLQMTNQIRVSYTTLKKAISTCKHSALVSSYGVGFRYHVAQHDPVCIVGTTDNSQTLNSLGLPHQINGLNVILEPAIAINGCFRLFNPKPHSGVAIRGVNADAFGTLGAFVKRDEKIFGLTCEHIFTKYRNINVIGMGVEWCATSNDPEGTNWHPLGTIAEVGHVGSNNGIDSALIKLAITPSFKNGGVGRISVDPVDPMEAVAMRATVQKYGYSSKKTFGRVESIINISINTGHAHPPVIHKDVLEIAGDEPTLFGFCEGGDSGSLVYLKGYHKKPAPVGLLISTSLGAKGYAIPIGKVLDYHKARLINK